MEVLVTIQKGSLDKSFVKRVLEKAYNYLKEKKDFKKEINQLSVAFVSLSTIQEINACYRGIDKVTDVLSFEDPPEILACLEAIKIQAKNKDEKLKDELALVLVHSLLHIFGFDHKDEEGAKEMQNLERKILSNLNIKKYE